MTDWKPIEKAPTYETQLCKNFFKAGYPVKRWLLAYKLYEMARTLSKGERLIIEPVKGYENSHSFWCTKENENE